MPVFITKLLGKPEHTQPPPAHQCIHLLADLPILQGSHVFGWCDARSVCAASWPIHKVLCCAVGWAAGGRAEVLCRLKRKTSGFSRWFCVSGDDRSLHPAPTLNPTS